MDASARALAIDPAQVRMTEWHWHWFLNPMRRPEPPRKLRTNRWRLHPLLMQWLGVCSHGQRGGFCSLGVGTQCKRLCTCGQSGIAQCKGLRTKCSGQQSHGHRLIPIGRGVGSWQRIAALAAVPILEQTIELHWWLCGHPWMRSCSSDSCDCSVSDGNGSCSCRLGVCSNRDGICSLQQGFEQIHPRQWMMEHR